MLDIREYTDGMGRSPHGDWFETLDASASARVTIALTRMSLGHLSNVKSVGRGVSELKIDFGPGYRIYFGRDGDVLVILLGGGTKKRQNRDILEAQAEWQDYKTRKKEARNVSYKKL